LRVPYPRSAPVTERRLGDALSGRSRVSRLQSEPGRIGNASAVGARSRLPTRHRFQRERVRRPQRTRQRQHRDDAPTTPTRLHRHPTAPKPCPENPLTRNPSTPQRQCLINARTRHDTLAGSAGGTRRERFRESSERATSLDPVDDRAVHDPVSRAQYLDARSVTALASPPSLTCGWE
jgi:hypothetical protein